jgi:hypothetical protein
MSIAGDLARYRAVFAGLVKGAAMPAAEEPRPVLPAFGEVRRVAEETAIPARRSAVPAEPAAAEVQPRRTVYSLGAPPESGERRALQIATEVAYPEVREVTAALQNESGIFSDDAYKSLLRRFDAEARQESQLMGEEGLL